MLYGFNDDTDVSLSRPRAREKQKHAYRQPDLSVATGAPVGDQCMGGSGPSLWEPMGALVMDGRSGQTGTMPKVRIKVHILEPGPSEPTEAQSLTAHKHLIRLPGLP